MVTVAKTLNPKPETPNFNNNLQGLGNLGLKPKT